MNSTVAAIRASLEALVPTPPPAGPAWSTGIPSLDAALGGGIPRGRLTELVGERASGRTTLARRVVAQVLQSGGWVAIVDATRTLAPQAWASLGSRLVVIRPRDPGRATWCADRLLRSGVFGLVVLDGAPVLPRPLTFRLSQLARDRDAALLVVGTGHAATAGGAGIRLRLVTPESGASVRRSSRRSPPSMNTRTVVIDKGAAPARAVMPRVVGITVRLPNTMTGADRRGAARQSRRPWGTRRAGTPPPLAEATH